MNIHASNQRHSCHCYLCVHPKYTGDITRPEEKIASDPDSDKMTFCIFFKWLFSFHKHYMTFGLTRVASSCSCPTKPQQLDNSFRGIREDSDTQLLPPPAPAAKSTHSPTCEQRWRCNGSLKSNDCLPWAYRECREGKCRSTWQWC